MRPDVLADARRWLRQGREDLITATRLREMGIHYASCFFSQQAAEKAMKGALLSLGLVSERTHSVVTLARAVEDQVPDLAGLTVDLGFLDQYYIPTRYPDALPGGVPADSYGMADSDRAIAGATRAIAAAERVFG